MPVTPVLIAARADDAKGVLECRRRLSDLGWLSRHGQAAGFRPAKVFSFVDRLSWFAPLVRAA